MEAMRRLQLELPEDVAADIEARVASGEYENERAVVCAAVEKLIEREQAEETWLRTTIAARVEALDSGQVRTKTGDEVRGAVDRGRAGRSTRTEGGHAYPDAGGA